MFRTFLLMLFLCGLTSVSVVLSYRASARFPYDCQPVRVCLPETPPRCETIPCLPDVRPPACELPVCSTAPHSLHHRTRTCLGSLHVGSQQVFPSPSLIGFPCFLFREDKLNTVARVSTADITRAISR